MADTSSVVFCWAKGDPALLDHTLKRVNISLPAVCWTDWMTALLAKHIQDLLHGRQWKAVSEPSKRRVALASHPREQGAGVAVTRFWKIGNVDYKKVPVLQGLDLNCYRGKARAEVRVTAVP